jgi:hypothetical protein
VTLSFLDEVRTPRLYPDRDRLSGAGLKPPPSRCGKEPWWRALEEKCGNKLVQVSVRETNESEPFEDASLST